jgi:hypothetical protein
MKIRTALFLITIVTIAFSSVSATPCTLTPAKAPMLFGFKFDMAQEAAEKRAGEKAEENGVISWTADGKYENPKTGDMYIVLFNKKQDSKILDNTADSMSLDFMDGKLFEMVLDLNYRSLWVKAPDPTAFFQKQFGIPANAWAVDPSGDFKKKATCSGVTVYFTPYKGAMKFKISETAVRQRIDAAGKTAR